MYWENQGQVCRFSRATEPRARKTHICCECGEKISIGRIYFRIDGMWEENGGWTVFDSFVFCSQCREAWLRVVGAFHDHGEFEACIVGRSLEKAIEEAVDRGFLEPADPFVQKWLPDIMEEMGISEADIESSQTRVAVSQMRAYSQPFL
jgi:hypothetical protein